MMWLVNAVSRLKVCSKDNDEARAVRKLIEVLEW